jgi:hypothetical protein
MHRNRDRLLLKSSLMSDIVVFCFLSCHLANKLLERFHFWNIL